MQFELTIDELVLHGFRAGDRHLIAAAVEQELTRLLAASGPEPGLAAGGQRARIDGGSFQVVPGASAEAIGTQVAQAVFRGIQP